MGYHRPTTKEDVPAPTRAEQLGVRWFAALPNTLLLDLDERDTPKARSKALLTINDVLIDDDQVPKTGLDVLFTTSRSGNLHAYVLLASPRQVPLRVAMQSAMGSDHWRDTWSLQRWTTQTEVGREVVLFETATEAPRVEAWLEKARAALGA